MEISSCCNRYPLVPDHIYPTRRTTATAKPNPKVMAAERVAERLPVPDPSGEGSLIEVGAGAVEVHPQEIENSASDTKSASLSELKIL